MVSPEGPPLQRAGALIDVMDALPRAVRARGNEISVALPFYREIRENAAFKAKDTGVTVDVQVGKKTPASMRAKQSGLAIFIRRDGFLIDRGIWKHGKAYDDNARLSFCKATELARRLTPSLKFSILRISGRPRSSSLCRTYSPNSLTIHLTEQGVSRLILTNNCWALSRCMGSSSGRLISLKPDSLADRYNS